MANASATPAPPPLVVERSARSKRSSGLTRGINKLWIFLLPAAAVYIFVVLWPSLQGTWFAFTDWDGLSQVKSFIGFDNFVQLFNDPKAAGAVVRTLAIAFTITIVQNLIGLLLALGVNSRIKSRNVLRVALFAPAVITPVATAYLWQNLYSTDGAINSLFDVLGLGAFRQSWLGNPDVAIWSICIVVVWQFSGYSMVIFLANLQSISPDVIEATYVDGAGPFRRFWSIVRPELRPRDHHHPHAVDHRRPQAVRPGLGDDRRWTGWLDRDHVDPALQERVPAG